MLYESSWRKPGWRFTAGVQCCAPLRGSSYQRVLRTIKPRRPQAVNQAIESGSYVVASRWILKPEGMRSTLQRENCQLIRYYDECSCESQVTDFTDFCNFFEIFYDLSVWVDSRSENKSSRVVLHALFDSGTHFVRGMMIISWFSKCSFLTSKIWLQPKNPKA